MQESSSNRRYGLLTVAYLSEHLSLPVHNSYRLVAAPPQGFPPPLARRKKDRGTFTAPQAPHNILRINAPLNSTGPVGPPSLGTPPLGSRLMARVGTSRTSPSAAVRRSSLS